MVTLVIVAVEGLTHIEESVAITDALVSYFFEKVENIRNVRVVFPFIDVNVLKS